METQLRLERDNSTVLTVYLARRLLFTINTHGRKEYNCINMQGFHMREVLVAICIGMSPELGDKVMEFVARECKMKAKDELF